MDEGIDDPENEEYGKSLKALYDSFGGEDQYWEYMREETRTSSQIEKYFCRERKKSKKNKTVLTVETGMRHVKNWSQS